LQVAQNPANYREIRMPNWPKQSGCDAYYGDPRGKNGQASAKWESANLVKVPVPWKMVASWDPNIPIKSIRVHKNCAASLTRIMEVIWRDSDYEQATIAAWGMDKFGGGYNYRLTRGGSWLSMHAYGCAVDFDPARNGMGDRTPYFANCPEVLAAFKSEGWTWGGDWSNPDGMHWQAASL
jgi:hypothetical protein